VEGCGCERCGEGVRAGGGCCSGGAPVAAAPLLALEEELSESSTACAVGVAGAATGASASA
jgi:hypothetical protein